MVDRAFKGAGKKAGLELWRIENKTPVRINDVNGKFYSGDSYILLATVKKNSSLVRNIHFWLGSETSQDEAGIAAHKSVELDDSLGGSPIQYREVQGNESTLFTSYFKSHGLEYLPGGVASGFHHVVRDSYETRLLQLKGKRTVRANQVPLSSASLNTGDVFILDAGLKIFLWNGSEANLYEKAKGVQMASKIRNQERGGRAEIILVNEDPSNEEFWGALGGQINVTAAGKSDEKFERSSAPSLFQISDAGGSVACTACPRDENGRLARSQLSSDDVFLVDAGSELYVWVGKGASKEERKQGMVLAQNYLTQNNKPHATRIQRVVEGGETPVFKGLFFQWEPTRAFWQQSPRSSHVAAAREQKAVDMNRLHTHSVGSTAEQAIGTDGSVQIWRVENLAKVEWPQEKYGQFYGGDSYIVLYTYTQGNKEAYMLYFWLGRDSSQDEKGSAAILATELDDSMGGKPVQVRVVQGKEPAHFRAIFQGKMVVHCGGVASGFKNLDEGDSYDTDGVSLYHVKGTNANNTAAVQVAEEARSLNSGDCFVLLTPATMYTWNGGSSSRAERKTAGIIASELHGLGGVDRAIVALEEGKEDPNFWGFLGGKGEYSTLKATDEPTREPRLFQMSNATGVFDVVEIENFAQEDLIDEDVMLLDCFSTVFMWVGSSSNVQEKRMALQTAQTYIDTAHDGRDEDTPIVMVKPGTEPSMFTINFLGWDAEYASKHTFVDPYEAKLAKMRAQREEEAAEAYGGSSSTASPEDDATPTCAAGECLSYAVLKKAGGVPGVDPTKKHTYLSNSEFQTVFGMDKAAFGAMPGWKQTALKKEKGLF